MSFGLKFLLIVLVLCLMVMAFSDPAPAASSGISNCNPPAAPAVEAGVLTANLIRGAYRAFLRLLNLQSEDVMGQ